MPTGTHHEIEIKLDVDPDFGLPDLTALAAVGSVGDAVRHDLEATYFDSDDFRLIHGGTTLRRRTGGDDAGWHLKLAEPLRDPSGQADSRLEIHRPLGRSARSVPAALLGLVRVQLRGETVGPVARISTTRTVRHLIAPDGTVLAEVADDLVTATAMGRAAGDGMTVDTWREIEVELTGGDLDLLGAARSLLLAAGARPSDVHSKISRALGTRLSGPSGALDGPDGTDPNGTPNGTPDGTPDGTGPTDDGTGGKADAVVGSAADLPAGPVKKKHRKGKKATRKVRIAPPAETVVTGPVAIGDVAEEYLGGQLAQLIAMDPRVRLDTADAVHQMRVATRRLRTALATFRPVFGPGTGDELRAGLKWLGGVLGAARDAEVMREKLLGETAALPAELVLGPVTRRIRLELDAAHKAAHREVIAVLDGERYLQLVEALEQFVTAPPFTARAAEPAVDELGRLVRKAGRRVGRAVGVLSGEVPGTAGHDVHLHEVRIAAKRARYAAEAAVPLIGKPAKQVAKAMEALQETLGDHQDGVLERQWLRTLAVRASGANESAFTFGLLHGSISGRSGHDEKLFSLAWDRARAALAHWPA